MYLSGELIKAHAVTEFSCGEGHTWSTTPTQVLRGSRCPSCATHGFRPDMPATFYIQLLRGVHGVFLKFGITSRAVERRVLDQQRHSKFSHYVLYSLTLENGKDIVDIEREVKIKIKTRVVDKSSLPDGYTETCSVFDYNNIMRIINEKLN